MWHIVLPSLLEFFECVHSLECTTTMWGSLVALLLDAIDYTPLIIRCRVHANLWCIIYGVWQKSHKKPPLSSYAKHLWFQPLVIVLTGYCWHHPSSQNGYLAKTGPPNHQPWTPETWVMSRSMEYLEILERASIERIEFTQTIIETQKKRMTFCKSRQNLLQYNNKVKSLRDSGFHNDIS